MRCFGIVVSGSLLLLMAVCSGFDSLWELRADVPRRVEVSIEKRFDRIVLSNQDREMGCVIPRAIVVKVLHNGGGPFSVELIHPGEEGGSYFTMISEDVSDIRYYLTDGMTGKSYFPGSALVVREGTGHVYTKELVLDLVILPLRQEGVLGNGYWGRLGVTIVDL